FFQAEDGIRDDLVTGVQTCALPISPIDGTHASILGVVTRPQRLRSTAVTTPRIEACVPSMGEYAGLCGISQTWPSLRCSVLTVRSEERRVGKGLRGRG